MKINIKYCRCIQIQYKLINILEIVPHTRFYSPNIQNFLLTSFNGFVILPECTHLHNVFQMEKYEIK